MKLDQASASAAALVATKVMDCLIQALMNKELLLPSEVNDLSSRRPLDHADHPVDENHQLVQHLAPPIWPTVWAKFATAERLIGLHDADRSVMLGQVLGVHLRVLIYCLVVQPRG